MTQENFANSEEAARAWLAQKAQVTALAQQRAAAAKELKEIEKRLHAFLRAEPDTTISVDGHTIGLTTSVKEQ